MATNQKDGIGPRMAALDLLTGVLKRGDRLRHLVTISRARSPEDLATAQRLATTVLRNVGRADALLAPFIKRKPKLEMHNILRLSAVDYFENETPDYVVVDQAVRMAKSRQATRAMSGFANAVLREVTSADKEEWHRLPPQVLPKWMSDAFTSEFGERCLKGIEQVHAERPPLDLTVRNDQDGPRLAGLLDATLLPTGSLRIPRPGQVSLLPGYRQGKWWVQDAAAAIPIRLLGELKGRTVLDLCAAPGGKSLQCASLDADLTALDRSGNRIGILRDNLKRTGLKARTVCVDALEFEPEKAIDVAVVDAPCSATGTIRRNPDLTHRLRSRPAYVDDLVVLQRKLLQKAVDCVREGGLVLYCVCSLLPEEGEFQIREFLGRESVSVVEFGCSQLGLDRAWVTREGGLRLRPDYWAEQGGMDGFYAVVLRRN